MTKLEINDTKTASAYVQKSMASAPPTNGADEPLTTGRLIPIAPEDELKSISLIKNTIKQSSLSPVLNSNANILAETTKIKHDLDEAFKDLLSVSASLRDIENRASISPASSFRRRQSTGDEVSTGKPIPAPRKRPTTLDIRSPILPAVSPTKPVLTANQRISIVEKEEKEEIVRKAVISRTVPEEKKTVTGRQPSHAGFNLQKNLKKNLAQN